MTSTRLSKHTAAFVLGALACSFLAASPASAASHKKPVHGVHAAVHGPALHGTALHASPVHRAGAHGAHVAASHERAHASFHLASRHAVGHHAEGHRVALRGHHAYRHVATSYRHSRLQCVPYAREVSHIELSGNAFIWWAEAAGRYARGETPEQGAVLDFRSERRMPLGHVAVVTSVIDDRTVLVTQANWVPGTITNDVEVHDVSPDNNWSQVQVQLGDRQVWGATYSTYGFIYNRSDAGTVVAQAGAPGAANEVAEAPKLQPLTLDAPNRNLR